jgi:hypothetical protein
MRTYRTFSLTATGLLGSLGAAAQSTGMSPANEDMLSWMLHVLLGAVGIVAALASIALLTAAANRSSFRQEQAAALANASAAPAPVVAPASEVVTPAPAAVASALAPIALTQELVLSE